MPVAGGFAVGAEVADPRRPLARVQVDPHAVHLDAAACIARQRPPPSGRDRRYAAAPGGQLDLAVAGERLVDVDANAAHEPEMLGDPPPRLGDIVDGDVLEKASDRVEPQPPGLIHVGETDAAAGGVRPAL